MGYLFEGILQAAQLLFSGNEETYSAIITTLKTSSLSICASIVMGLPAGFMLGYFTFPGKKQLRIVVDTLLALPTVVVGLFLYAFISKRGPLGEWGLLFSIPGMAVAQTILVLPIVIALTATAVESLDPRLKMTLRTLGAGKKHIFVTSVLEARYAVIAAVITAWGRAISEVGASMMIGGNIKWDTRTITTAIALETGKGEFAMGIALGGVLLLLGFLANWLLVVLKRKA